MTWRPATSASAVAVHRISLREGFTITRYRPISDQNRRFGPKKSQIRAFLSCEGTKLCFIASSADDIDGPFGTRSDAGKVVQAFFPKESSEKIDPFGFLRNERHCA